MYTLLHPEELFSADMQHFAGLFTSTGIRHDSYESAASSRAFVHMLRS